MKTTRTKTARVPSTRLGRLAQLGWLAGELASRELFRGLRGNLRNNPLEAARSVLSTNHAELMTERLAKMRGAAMKLGQMLSLEGKDILPPDFAKALERLRSQAYTMPVRQLTRVLEEEYGRDWQKCFKRFHFTPLAAASIGQVHYAETKDERRVALKIQYPGVRRSIDSDVDNTVMFMRLLKVLPESVDLLPILAEVKRQLHQEADYQQEARWLSRYRSLIGENNPKFVVPRMHADLTTKNVLAMDYLQGVPIDTLTAGDYSQCTRDRVATQLMDLLFREIFQFRLIQTDPNYANFLYQNAADRIILLDFGATRELEASFTRNYVKLCDAGLKADAQEMRTAALRIGYIAESDRRVHAEGMLRMILLGCEPIQVRGPYDFGHSDLPLRVAEVAQELVLQHGLMRPPPPETLFLHRKLIGMILLCGRLRARVDLRELIAPYLSEASRAAAAPAPLVTDKTPLRQHTGELGRDGQ